MTEQLEKKMRNELYGWHIGEDNPAISGIEWYLNNLWHDASEKSLKPLGTKVLALFDDGALVELSIVDMNDIGGVVKYAYIEDLLPSDLTGIK